MLFIVQLLYAKKNILQNRGNYDTFIGSYIRLEEENSNVLFKNLLTDRESKTVY